MRKIKLIEVKSELGAGTRGASMGVDAIKIAALDFGSLYFRRYRSVEVPHENKLLLEPIRHEYAKRIEGIIRVCERIGKEIEKTIHVSKSFPVVLAGDHSTAVGTIAGIRASFPDKRLGVIWVDAHADIHSPYTTLSGNVHGMPLAAVLGEDNLEQSGNKPDEATIALWEQFKNIGGICPKINYSDLLFMGVRDTEKQEDHAVHRNKVRNFTVSEIRRKGPERAGFEALSLLDHCDILYISFDVDVIDPSISKGTGTPVPNGLTEKETGTLIARLLKSRKVCGFEVVEVNPTLDRENLMAEKTFEILLKATNQLINEL